MNGNVTAVVAGIALIITIVGAVVLPLRAAINAVNERINRERVLLEREVTIIEKNIKATDDKLQIEIIGTTGTLAAAIEAIDIIALERHNNQGIQFNVAIKAIDEKLQAEIALVSSQTETSIAQLEERIKSLRELFSLIGSQ